MIHVTDLDGVKHYVSANGVDGKDGAAPRPYEVKLAKSYLETCKRTKTTFVSSYGLKHLAEEWAGIYISNGALITAAVELGFGIKYRDHYGPNAGIAVSKTKFKRSK